ncbi:hypothetical protein [Flavihumibacter profundi]|jgi:hypothetical protein|uniref:hypothetical protein n=1 Tax=Flavihumibacter profundi TaxID=2716883 RepID=UPI001CC71A57|nr:hypothetical protein [Flavihumibacter profundi]MBZ5855645.1 hypothetical protein [Flavihumibacter profundi]
MYRFEPENQRKHMEIYLRYALALAFVLVLTWWLTRISDLNFGWKRVLIAMMAKIFAGSAYGFLYLHFYGGDDTWMINGDSLLEMDKLINRPGHFFEDIDLIRLVGQNGLHKGLRLFQEKLELALMIKPLAIANLWSKGNYYINVVFFSAITFWGHFWLYQVISKHRPYLANVLFLIIFLYPPILFWLSGIRSDGLLFLFFSMSLWQFDRWLIKQNRITALGFLLGWLGMSIIRPPFAALFIPAYAAWWLAEGKKWNPKKAFGLVYAIAILFFFITTIFPAPFNLPETVAHRQAEFFVLHGRTRVAIDTLNAKPISFIKALPGAIDNTVFRPYPWQATGILQYLMVIQNIFLICLFLAILFKYYSDKKSIPPESIFRAILAISISTYLSIGYTIPFPGALVRYRAIPELCLLIIGSLGIMAGDISNYNYFNVYKKKVI